MAGQVRDVAGLGTWRRESRTVVRQATAIPQNTPVPFVIVAESEIPDVPVEWVPHSHSMHELVWAHGGTLASRVGNRVFTVPEGCGLWMPAGVVHAGRLTANVEFYDAFFAADKTPVAFGEPTAITMTPVLESLLMHLARTDLRDDERARAEAVVFDVLEPSPRQLTLQLPGDATIDLIARTLLDNPADNRTLDDWSRHIGISSRTITRAFRRSTGLSFAQWRQALRIHHALKLLSEGVEVRDSADLLGYAQPSTFIAAFRRVMGVTPGAFCASGTGR